MSATAKRTFGVALRALRLGYRWSDQLRCYVRISPSCATGWRIDLAPAHKVPADRGTVEYVPWWEADDDVFSVCPALGPLALQVEGLAGPRTLYVNDDGELVP